MTKINLIVLVIFISSIFFLFNGSGWRKSFSFFTFCSREKWKMLLFIVFLTDMKTLLNDFLFLLNDSVSEWIFFLKSFIFNFLIFDLLDLNFSFCFLYKSRNFWEIDLTNNFQYLFSIFNWKFSECSVRF